MGTRLASVTDAAKSASVDAPRPRILVLDGHSMAFRAFYALNYENFYTDKGEFTNAVYGFTSMLLKMIEQREPTHVAVAFDLSGPTFRSEEYEEYKGGRDATPEPFKGQIEMIEALMHALNIPTISMEGFEADDIIASVSSQGQAAGYDVIVVSGDRDAFQLIDEHVTVLYPKKGVSDIPPMDADAVMEKYGVWPANYPDLAALVGEKADNLPGVPGVGPKTAAKWINLYGTAEQVLEHADEIRGKAGENLRAHADDVRRNRKLNALVRTLELPVPFEEMELGTPDAQELDALFTRFEFKTLRKRVADVFAVSAEPAEQVEVPEAQLLADAGALAAWIGAGAGAVHALAAQIEMPDGALPGSPGDVASLALAREGATAWIDPTELDAEATQALADYLADSGAPKVLHDAKVALKAFRARGLELDGVVDDTMISAYIDQPDRRSHELSDLVQIYLQESLEEETAPSVQGELALDLDHSATAQAAARRADAVRRLHAVLAPVLEKNGQTPLLRDLELPLSRVLVEMEAAGIAVDVERLEALIADFGAQMERAKEEAYAAIGHEVNLGSPKQLQVVLFEELDLPKTKKIKTGYTTDAASLQELLEKTGHPFLAALMAHRDASKLKQTVEGLRKAVAEDGRIHTTYAQTIAATGRLSSLNPNLQNIPVRSEEGRRIREVFTVGAGYEILLTADYSQIEMRILVHLAQDEALIQAFKDGEDLHRFVGSHVFGVEPEDVTPAMRSKVKAMSYGLAYGLSSFGLSKQLNIGVDEARTLMSDYYKRFGAVREYLSGVVTQAHKDGFTETLLGRRRNLPDLKSDVRQAKDAAERAALNAPIQGTAADIIKVAMLKVRARLEAAGLRSRLLLQVHDELVLEVAPGELEAVTALVEEEMGSAMELSVPLDVHVGVGATWHDAAH
ncbi:MAG: DNA polymerase I [Arthrobacter sp.]|nr:DNA polymerase I [Arthrobacter sp.]